VKERKEDKRQKRVTFADPIATELKPPKINIQDDSIMPIKGNSFPNVQHSSSDIVVPDFPASNHMHVIDRYTVMVED
jgi:hypothetical protein